jgi:TRAP-type mannitol/chloroaromatic compound transport system, small permease component
MTISPPVRSPGARVAAAAQAAADRLAVAGAWLAAACVVALTGLVLTEIGVALLGRLVPGMPSSIHFGWEYSGYLMGASFLLGAGLTLRAGLQIRVEMLMRAGSARFARALETAASLIGAGVAIFLAMALVTLARRTWRFGEVSQDTFTPLWMPQAVLAFGAVLLALQLCARVLTCLAGQPANRPELGASTAIE